MTMPPAPPCPLEQAYWVLPGRFLAGEYPRTTDAESSNARLNAMTAAGIDLFVDLTHPADGLLPYEDLLERVSGGTARRHVAPIPDAGTPGSAEFTRAVLDVLDAALADGRGVYVHCWGGIGRTGTIVGCWLARHGRTGDEALTQLSALWAACPKSARCGSPETAAQRAYIANWSETRWDSALDRAQGCLLGQLAGDALGSLVEFQEPDRIRRKHPNGLCVIHDGGHWDTIAGQPTDDSEMALMLARSIVERKGFDAEAVFARYLYWRESGPFDMGNTIRAALRGQLSPESQANGALMRVSPLGIYGARHRSEQVAAWARADAALTHPNAVCLQANALFANALAFAVRTGAGPQAVYAHALHWAHAWEVDASLVNVLDAAATAPPASYEGWVLNALQNALYQLLHAPSLEEALVNTVMQGADSDTNAAICGALLGAVHGRDAIPKQWQGAVLNCRPEAGRPGVEHPRPECFWPVDALELAAQLLG